MIILFKSLVTLVAVLHLFFLVLEMFLWTKPLGLKIFRNSPEKAQQTKVLAANQGLYNGFLSAGLIAALCQPTHQMMLQFAQYFLGCVVVAGIFGAWTVSKKIFWVQAFPAIIALVAMYNL